MGVKIKHTDPTLNSFSTDDIIVNVSEGSLFFKSNTELFRIKGDTISTTVTESFGDELWFRSGNNLYYTSGSVGIGTTSPSYNLDVHGAANGIIRAYGPTIGRLSLQNNTRHYSLSVQGSTLFFYDETGGATRAVIDSSGNVGIGTTSPAEKLHIVGNIQATGSSNVDLEASTSTGTGKARLVLNSFRPAAGSMGTSTLFKSGSATFFDTDETFNIRPNGRTAFLIQGNGDIAFVSSSTADANTTTYLFGDASTRNIGIGTSSPDAKLEVAADGTTSQEIAHFGNSSGVGKIKLQIDGAGSSKQVMLDASNNEDIVLSTQGDSYFNVSHGNVGIGTNAPAYKLDLGENSSTIRLVSEDNGTAIRIGAGGASNDVTLLRVDGSTGNHDGETDDSNFGFSLKYMGSRSDNANGLSIFSDAQEGTAVEAFTVIQNGLIGIGNSVPKASTHDNTYNPAKLFVEGMVSASNGYEITSFQTSSAAHTKGWYTIATANYGRAFGRFSIEDRSSGRHQGHVFYASAFFGGTADEKRSIDVISSARYSSTNAITAIKITSGGTYTGHALQVYLTQANASITTRFLGDDGGSTGWKLIPMLTGSIDPGDMALEGASNTISSDDDTWSNGFPNNLEFDLGNCNQTGTTGDFQINGDLNVDGTVSKGGGSFKIDHPDPLKTDTHYLYHNFVESPTEGDNIYRWTITTTNNTHTIDLPDYYRFLNKNDMVWVNAVDHFGRAYGTINNEQTKLTIISDTDGKYNVLLIGTRKDQFIKDNYKGVEVKK